LRRRSRRSLGVALASIVTVLLVAPVAAADSVGAPTDSSAVSTAQDGSPFLGFGAGGLFWVLVGLLALAAGLLLATRRAGVRVPSTLSTKPTNLDDEPGGAKK
jgi:hypothetical protein